MSTVPEEEDAAGTAAAAAAQAARESSVPPQDEEEERLFLELPPRTSRSPRNSLGGGGGGGGHHCYPGGGGGYNGDSSSRNNSGCSVGSNASSTISWSSLQALRLAAAKARSSSLPHHGSIGGGGQEEAEMQAAVYEYSLVLAGGEVPVGLMSSAGGSSKSSRGTTPPTSASNKEHGGGVGEKLQLKLPQNVSLFYFLWVGDPPIQDCKLMGENPLLQPAVDDYHSLSASPTPDHILCSKKGELLFGRALLPRGGSRVTSLFALDSFSFPSIEVKVLIDVCKRGKTSLMTTSRVFSPAERVLETVPKLSVVVFVR